ncbi:MULTISPECIES: DNA translocase FtsK [unclassified Pseudomonas]|uniref:DNA translocase FtsK n=1 Tax=unclassified Pseudomonas TaxID=196821 RepID=UPI0039B74F46
MSWFDRFFQFPRTDEIDQPAAHPRPSRNDLSKPSVALAGPYSDIDDSMYIQAISFVLESQRASVSGIQRHLKIGCNRAARFIETMEFDGIVSSLSATGERRLLSTEERSSYLLRRNVEPTPPNIEVEQKTRRGKKLPSPEKMDLPPLTGKIRGTKDMGFNIVGESHFQAALRQIRNSRCLAVDNDFEAFILTEPDNPHDANACAVFIDGFKVGYLPRDAAASFVDQIADQGVQGVSCFQLRAKLVGGYGTRLNIGVMVNLPTGDE